ncbi:MAG TPA: hypothetical protein VF588_19850 [Pyrinomonadaceae bacterium]|jgi:hypothetical protein
MSASKSRRAFRRLLLLLPLLLAAPAAYAQDAVQPPPAHPSLAGTWIPKVEKESMPDAGPAGWTKVVVEQRDPALKFSVVHGVNSKSKNYEHTYYTDGRGETNGGMVYFFIIANNKAALAEVKSKSAWEGGALVVVHRVSMPDMVITGGVVSTSLDVTMRWEVSPDGKLLTRTIKQSNYSAVFRQIVPEGKIKETELPVNGGKQQATESRDTYVLLEEKR